MAVTSTMLALGTSAPDFALPDVTTGETRDLSVRITKVGDGVAIAFRDITADRKQFDPEYLAYIAPQMAVGVGLALREPGDDDS